MAKISYLWAMHYFISAGEPSGDLHASALMEAIKIKDPQAQFTFLGGDLMTSVAGHEPVIHYSRMAFMGFSEVLRNLRTIFGNFNVATGALRESMADALVLVDYPSFNIKLAKEASKLGIPTYYFIAPKVWAWKEWRVKDLRRYIRKILSILPFEEEYFASKNVDAVYVGNPSREEIDQRISQIPPREEFLLAHGLDANRRILALIPGSRRGEIRCNLPIMDAVARRHSDMQVVVAGAPGVNPELYKEITDMPVITGKTFDLMCYADVALVTSGTATLECALAGTPQVVCYRANGVKLSYNIMKHLLKVRYVSLPNLIADEPVIPEMLVHLCTVDSVDAELCKIIPGSDGCKAQIEGYSRMRSRLGENPAAATAAECIITDIKTITK